MNVSEININPEYRSKWLGSDFLNRIPSMMDVQNCLIALKAFLISYDDYGKASSSQSIHMKSRPLIM